MGNRPINKEDMNTVVRIEVSLREALKMQGLIADNKMLRDVFQSEGATMYATPMISEEWAEMLADEIRELAISYEIDLREIDIEIETIDCDDKV